MHLYLIKGFLVFHNCPCYDKMLEKLLVLIFLNSEFICAGYFSGIRDRKILWPQHRIFKLKFSIAVAVVY